MSNGTEYISDKVVRAGKEICDVVGLITDGEDNGPQVAAFIKETIEAGGASWQLKSHLVSEDYKEALAVAGQMIAGKISTDKITFSDGSGIEVSIEAIPPQDIDVPGDPAEDPLPA